MNLEKQKLFLKQLQESLDFSTLQQQLIYLVISKYSHILL
jgi:hypothetical protein